MRHRGHRVSPRPAGQLQNAFALGPQRFPHWTRGLRAQQSLRPLPPDSRPPRAADLAGDEGGRASDLDRGLVLEATSAWVVGKTSRNP